MSARERAERLLKEYVKGAVSRADDDERVKQLFDGVINMVKEECCSGELKWETPKLCQCQQDEVDRMVTKIKEAADNFTLNANPPPPLIQGYTAEQWQEIIDGGYVVEFPDGNMNWCQCRLKDFSVNDSVTFECIHGYEYLECRPAQIKGVMRPIFVEPVDNEAWCVFMWRDTEGGWGIKGDGHWNEFKKENSTAYIEV